MAIAELFSQALALLAQKKIHLKIYAKKCFFSAKNALNLGCFRHLFNTAFPLIFEATDDVGCACTCI